jgi:hypothetical protein
MNKKEKICSCCGGTAIGEYEFITCEFCGEKYCEYCLIRLYEDRVECPKCMMDFEFKGEK